MRFPAAEDLGPSAPSTVLCERNIQERGLSVMRIARVFLAMAATWTTAMTLGCGDAAPPIPSSSNAPEVAAISEEQQRLERFFADSHAEDMRRYPFTASYLGIKDQQDKWNNVSQAFVEETRRIDAARLEAIADFDPEQLSEARRLSQTLYRKGLERSQALEQYQLQRYVMHQHRGPHTSVPSSLINIHQISDVADAEAYIGRLRNVSDYFDQVIEQLNLRAEQNFLLVDWMYPRIIESAQNVVTGAPFGDGNESVIWSDFKSKVTALGLEQPEQTRLLAAAKAALMEQVGPAYQRLIATLQAQSTAAHKHDGIWRLDETGGFYQGLLQWYTTTDLSAEEIHQLGLENVDRIHQEMRAVMARVDFEGALPDFFQWVRQNQALRFSNDDAGREAYLAEAGVAIDAMRAKLPEYFGRLPQAELVIKRVEPFRERSAGKAFYQSPPPDGSRPGIYYANLYDMSAMPKTDIQALAFHEGIPGHHLQRAITAELDDIPEFQRYLGFTAFSEGWGLYSEYLAKEMGFYQDPYSEFGRLAMELWRAARLVVDTGIHALRWDREQAIQYLLDNTPNAESDCTKAIERYIAMPGQATAYMVGKIKILALRDMAQEALGEQFDMREFHDTVLGSGPVPLNILEDIVLAMIAAKQTRG